jgi:hypothetical protein
MADQATRRWPVQDAKARFSELLEASLNEGPTTRPPLKELLLAETPRAEIPAPPRRWRRRPPTAIE